MTENEGETRFAERENVEGAGQETGESESDGRETVRAHFGALVTGRERTRECGGRGTKRLNSVFLHR